MICLRLCLIYVLCFLPLVVFAKTAPITLEQILEDNEHRAMIGIRVEDPNTDKVLFAHQDHLLFHPASTLKLFTAAAALYGLGPDFRFETTLSGTVQNGHVDTLYVTLAGDPSLTTADLHTLARTLYKEGVRHIDHGIVFDTSYFKGPDWPAGWTVDSNAWDFQAPVNAAILDENAVSVVLDASERGPYAHFSDKHLTYPILNNIQVVETETANRWCSIDISMDKHNSVHVKGCWPKKHFPHHLHIAIGNSLDYFHVRLMQALKQAGITTSQKTHTGHAPTSCAPLASHQSEPLSKLIKAVLEDSNNLYSESLLKMLGVKLYQNGSFQGGVNAVKSILKKELKLDLRHTRIHDGSGASHYNLISITHMTTLLSAMRKSPYQQLFFDALPHSGYTGTLKYRLSTPTHRGRFIAKTGTITGTSALAGLVTTYKDQDLVFAVYVDQTTLTSRQARHLIDRICQKFLDF